MSGLRVRIHAADPVRRHGLIAMLTAAGHVVTEETPDVELCDSGDTAPAETEAPVVALTTTSGGGRAGILPPDATAEQLDLTLRAVAAGLLVRSSRREARVFAPAVFAPAVFAPAEEAPLLTPREREILGLLGEGLSNKAIARRLAISVHTVKFHMEALFAKLEATSRAEAVAKALRGGVIQL